MKPLRGTIECSGDKSIGHRALILAALANGASRIRGLGAGGDLASTRRVLAALGVAQEQTADGVLVHGRGLRGLRSPSGTLDCGNSGTTLRLLCGVLAGQPGLDAVLDGDASLRGRPMGRVQRVLAPFGARLALRDGGLPPIAVQGAQLRGAVVHTGVASAQVKSAALLAGLLADGETVVREPAASRDHTERMLHALGITVETSDLAVTLRPPGRVPPLDLELPGDLSSAAFWLAAAALLPGSDLTVTGVGLNPTRTGFLDVLRGMGADVSAEVEALRYGEPVGHVRLLHRPLRGVEVRGALALRALDELPLVAVLAATAEGETTVADAAELRVKECDRVEAMATGLRALGARVDPRPGGWTIEGVRRLRGAPVQVHGDHRVAMALHVAGLAAEGEVTLDDPACAAVSQPEFFRALRARLHEEHP